MPFVQDFFSHLSNMLKSRRFSKPENFAVRFYMYLLTAHRWTVPLNGGDDNVVDNDDDDVDNDTDNNNDDDGDNDHDNDDDDDNG